MQEQSYEITRPCVGLVAQVYIWRGIAADLKKNFSSTSDFILKLT
jgi:hypothetical protein